MTSDIFCVLSVFWAIRVPVCPECADRLRFTCFLCFFFFLFLLLLLLRFSHKALPLAYRKLRRLRRGEQKQRQQHTKKPFNSFFSSSSSSFGKWDGFCLASAPVLVLLIFLLLVSSLSVSQRRLALVIFKHPCFELYRWLMSAFNFWNEKNKNKWRDEKRRK